MSRLIYVLFFLSLLSILAKSVEDEDNDLMEEDNDFMVEDEDYDVVPDEEPVADEEDETPIVVEEPDYTVVEAMTNSLLFENFQDDNHFQSFWTHSASSDFPGRFKVGRGGDNPAISSELGLYVPKEAQRYAIFGETSSPFDFTKEKTFVVQYELRLHESLQCGGAYIKLTSEQGGDWKASDITNETPYTFMFGPDKCGSTNKVHFIYRFQNPVTKEYSEHHLESPPTPAGTSDKRSHLYTLVVRSDNTYEIFVDKETKKSGSLLKDFDPPVNPPKMIKDPEDLKPEDWVDEAKIEDPDAVKPEDWDEDAPRRITDPEDEKPEGWLDDESLQIADPDAQVPDDWDQEDDGEWEAPLIDNPACEAAGCGEWEAQMIDNPDYKGQWYSPMIDNPDYIGEWAAKEIENPSFFETDSPFAELDSVAGVAIDIWTMQKGIEYDNVYVGTSEDAAYELAANWQIRQAYQKNAMGSTEKSGSSSDMVSTVRNFVEENMMAIGATALLLVITLYFMCFWSNDLPAPQQQEEEEEENKDEKAKLANKADPAKAEKAADASEIAADG